MVELRKYKDADVPQFVMLCKTSFPAHNIFYGSLADVKTYLKGRDTQSAGYGGVYFAYEKGKLVGGALLRLEDHDKAGKHCRFKYNHLVAINDKVKKEILQELSAKIHDLIKQGKCKSAKVEVGLAENEKDLSFYLQNGSVQEGKLKSHYRRNETVFILGMEIPK